jgi:hypothetical protein
LQSSLKELRVHTYNFDFEGEFPMTIRVYSIEGRRGSACLHDAFSVVNEADGQQQLLDIIPTAELKQGFGSSDIRSAYEAAVRAKGSDDIAAVKKIARSEICTPSSLRFAGS